MASIQVLTIVAICLMAASAAPSYYGGRHYGGYVEPYQYYEDRDYRFNYLVRDDYTYNYQTHDEKKYGDTVTGQYTVLEPNGLLRVVNYIADDYGFRADVQHHPYNEKY